MNLNEKERTLLEEWMDDESFINWARQSDAHDISRWEHFFNHHPEHWEMGKIGREMVIGIPFNKIQIDNAESEKSLTSMLHQLDGKNIPKKKSIVNGSTNAKPIYLRRSWLVAASLIAFICISGSVYYNFFHVSEILLATKYGEQLETYLPDGSRITLNAHSRLKYFSDNPRKVWLEGEAFFEIEKKPETHEKFLVFTSDLKVTVLGTSFNVNARNDKTRVFLEEGKVDLQLDESEKEVIQMEPGDLVTYSKKQNIIKEKKNNVSSLEQSSWKVGTLIFNDTPLTQALYEIEDVYGIQFVLEFDKPYEGTITGGVPINNLRVTLETLNEVYGIIIKEDGKRYFITK